MASSGFPPWVDGITDRLDKLEQASGQYTLAELLRKIEQQGLDPAAITAGLSGTQLADGSVAKSKLSLFDSGVGSVAFAASNFSNLPLINHKLGVTPAVVLLTHGGGGSGIGYSVGITSTAQIQVQGWYPFGTLTGTFNFYWLALG